MSQIYSTCFLNEDDSQDCQKLADQCLNYYGNETRELRPKSFFSAYSVQGHHRILGIGVRKSDQLKAYCTLILNHEEKIIYLTDFMIQDEGDSIVLMRKLIKSVDEFIKSQKLSGYNLLAVEQEINKLEPLKAILAHFGYQVEFHTTIYQYIFPLKDNQNDQAGSWNSTLLSDLTNEEIDLITIKLNAKADYSFYPKFSMKQLKSILAVDPQAAILKGDIFFNEFVVIFSDDEVRKYSIPNIQFQKLNASYFICNERNLETLFSESLIAARNLKADLLVLNFPKKIKTDKFFHLYLKRKLVAEKVVQMSTDLLIPAGLTV